MSWHTTSLCKWMGRVMWIDVGQMETGKCTVLYHHFPTHGQRRVRQTRKGTAIDVVVCDQSMGRVLWIDVEQMETGKWRGFFGFFGPSRTFTCWGYDFFIFVTSIIICPINITEIKCARLCTVIHLACLHFQKCKSFPCKIHFWFLNGKEKKIFNLHKILQVQVFRILY